MSRVQDSYTDEDFEELLNLAESNAANDWEHSFISDLQEKYQVYGRRMYLSDSQKVQLERIANDI